MSETFLLSHTPTSAHRITLKDGPVTLIQETRFDFTAYEAKNLVWFLQAVKADATTRHTYTDQFFTLDYDPQNEELAKFVIMRSATARTIGMALSTAYRLLDALTGKTDRLVREDEGK